MRPFEAARRLSFRVGEAENEPVGSGVVVDAKHGYILTNDHVLLGSSRAVVVLADGRERIVSQIRRDPGVDLAVLVVDSAGLNLVQAKLGDPNALRPGDWVLSIGQSGGSAPALSAGIYGARRRGLGTPGISEEWLETDAAVNSLNSGGPLVNLSGEVVGINTSQTGRRAQVAGMSFALPADRARRVAVDLIAYGRVRHAFLGIQIEPVQRSSSDRPVPPGSVLIASVTPATPAAEAGLRPGDLIVAVSGRPVAGAAVLQGLIETAPIGGDLTITIERGEQRLDVVTRPRAQPVAAALGPGITGSLASSPTRCGMPGRVASEDANALCLVKCRPGRRRRRRSSGAVAPGGFDPIPKPASLGDESPNARLDPESLVTRAAEGMPRRSKSPRKPTRWSPIDEPTG